ncbi:hypothetical protein BJ973_002947 [Actinoplanes tereljensis]|uniref:hypothetical protein n=1 Tax=Paractinoplanes tereljensis TaxID=571912 RepID=UPI001941E327|nr:hypothetical protein [Actinoplanes tereljensis]
MLIDYVGWVRPEQRYLDADGNIRSADDALREVTASLAPLLRETANDNNGHVGWPLFGKRVFIVATKKDYEGPIRIALVCKREGLGWWRVPWVIEDWVVKESPQWFNEREWRQPFSSVIGYVPYEAEGWMAVVNADAEKR